MSWQNGETEAEPRVYLPSGDGEAPPAYEAYADPAAAHGWQDAYEEPYARAVDEPSEAEGGDADTVGQDVVAGEASDRRARLQRRRRARLLRRVVLAGGAACVALLAALIGGAFDSGSSPVPRPSGRSEGGAAGETASPTASTAPEQGSTTAPGTLSGPASEVSGVSASPGGTAASASASVSASKSASTGAVATATSTTTTEPRRGNANGNPGHGQGSTKRPR